VSRLKFGQEWDHFRLNQQNSLRNTAVPKLTPAESGSNEHILVEVPSGFLVFAMGFCEGWNNVQFPMKLISFFAQRRFESDGPSLGGD
jgi:hypothetical protein